jgi:ribosomal protein S18 acetylase RimI-like enzyme
MSISLRMIVPEDEKFLYLVYASTRADEMALVPWSAEQKEAFVRMQFDAQASYYTENYPEAEFQVIFLDDEPVGRLYVYRKPDEIHVIDIALLPEFRQRGIGSTLLQEILDEARTNKLPVTIHVERMNPALHLYERLGFHFVEEQGIYFLMEWKPVMKEVNDYAG